MATIVEIIERYILPVTNKLGSNKHMAAVRSGIIATLPLTIIGSFFVILLNIPNEAYMKWIAPYRATIDIPFRYTVGLMALYCAFSIASCLAKSYKLDQMTAGLLSVMAFAVSCIPYTQVPKIEGVINGGRWVNLAGFNAGSLFGAILCAIISVEIYRYMKEKNIMIKMPEGVPEGVVNSFAALYPTLAIIMVFWVVRYIFNVDINELLTKLLMPLKSVLVGNNLFGGLLTVFLIVFFWVFGIHGPAILGPIIRPMWDSAIAENMEVFAATGNAHELPYLFTEQFLQWYVWIGGAGSTLALSFLFLFSKSKYLKSLGKMTVVPGLFNINEPMIFGAPIVMNPILAIPFMVAPLVTTTLSYFVTRAGFIPLMMARLPFTVPAPIAAIISTNWSVGAGVLVMVNFGISLLIYYPFFKRYERETTENIELENAIEN